MTTTVVKGKNVLIGQEFREAQVHISGDGLIEKVLLEYDEDLQSSADVRVVDAGNLTVMPGIVDAHVHVNEPGRTDWEGYRTATQAAAAGGITTIVDMPLNCSPVTTTVDALKIKLLYAASQAYVNIAFWGGIIPDNQAEIKPMVAEGVCGFKSFLIHSGLDEYPHVTEEDLHKAYKELQDTESVYLFHAEVDCPDVKIQETDDKKYKKFLESRPELMEVEAIKLIIKMCKKYRVRSHIVHLSASSALPFIRQAIKEGAPLTVETCHHYLTLDSDTVPDGATEYKCCPPIREAANQAQLWDALKDGSISMVVSDHSPCTPHLKLPEKGDFMSAWGGVAGLQLGLSLFWTSCKSRGFTIQDLQKLMVVNTAKHASLSNVGSLQKGFRGDLVIWDPEATFTVTVENIHHKNKMTPYMGKTLNGVVHKTIVSGHIAYEKDLPFQEPKGKLLGLPQRSPTAKLSEMQNYQKCKNGRTIMI